MIRRMLRRLLVTVTVLATVSACSPGESAADPEPDRCGDAVTAWNDAMAAVDAVIAELEALIAAGTVTVPEDASGYDLLFVDPTTYSVSSGTDPEDVGWDEAQDEAIREVGIATRVVQDEAACFDPAEVAAAADLVDQLP